MKGDLRDKLEREVQIALGRPFGAGTWLTYELDAISQSPVIVFAYPSALAPEAGYIVPSVKLGSAH